MQFQNAQLRSYVHAMRPLYYHNQLNPAFSAVLTGRTTDAGSIFISKKSSSENSIKTINFADQANPSFN